MKIIVAVDKKWGIGKDNGLLFSIPEDMKFFRTTTLGKVVVMGANTLRSFPGENPLKNRTNIVLSSTIKRNDCITINSLDKLKEELLKYPQDDVYIIGGARFYQTMLPFVSEALVTKVDADGDADVFFPDLDAIDGWELVKSGEVINTGGYNITFNTYKNYKAKCFI